MATVLTTQARIMIFRDIFSSYRPNFVCDISCNQQIYIHVSYLIFLARRTGFGDYYQAILFQEKIAIFPLDQVAIPIITWDQ